MVTRTNTLKAQPLNLLDLGFWVKPENPHMGAVLKPLFTFYIKPEHEKQNQCFSVVAKDPRKHGERAGERVI